jgi:hypothetical protein
MSVGAAVDHSDPATRWLRRLCLFVIVVATAEFVIATTGVQIHRLPSSTDFASYYLAGAQARDSLSPYDRSAIAARGHALGFEYDQFPFLYPPPFALAMQPLAALSYPHARQVWMVLATLALLGAIAATAALAFRQARVLGIEDPRRVWIVLAAFVPSALNSTSVHNDIRAGSVGCLLFLLLALAARLVVAISPAGEGRNGTPPRQRSGRGGAALGLLLALATIAKLTPFVFVPWSAWRGARRAAVIALGLLVVSMVGPLAHWGVGIVPDYLNHVVVPSIRDEVAPPMNQSLDAFLSRLLVPSAAIDAPFDAPALKGVLSLGLGIALAAATLLLLLRRRVPAGLLPVEMGLVLLATLALMKLTWVQTLAAMLWVWPVVMLAVLRAAERGAPWARRVGLVACAGFFLSSAHVPILWEPLRHGLAVLVTGVHLIGILALWSACFEVLRRESPS